MVSAPDSRLNGSVSRPRQGYCIILMGKTLYFHFVSFHPYDSCKIGFLRKNLQPKPLENWNKTSKSSNSTWIIQIWLFHIYSFKRFKMKVMQKLNLIGKRFPNKTANFHSFQFIDLLHLLLGLQFQPYIPIIYMYPILLYIATEHKGRLREGRV